MKEAQWVKLSVDAGVATVLMDRPSKLNALSPEVLDELEHVVAALAVRSDLRCAIVTGAGKAFVAGADIAVMQGYDVPTALAFARRGHAIFDAIERLPIPVIAAVHGFALGGGLELALACDFLYAAEGAKLGQPEVKLGIIPGFGGTQRLARRVGIARARELIYTGRMLDAAEAERIGLTNGTVPADALLAKVRELADAIGAVGPNAVRRAKQVLREGEGLPLAQANALEMEAFAECFGGDERVEGMAAFLERRSPRFG